MPELEPKWRTFQGEIDLQSIGTFGGHCNRMACREPAARYWNNVTRRYYCRDCAHKINKSCPLPICFEATSTRLHPCWDFIRWMSEEEAIVPAEPLLEMPEHYGRKVTYAAYAGKHNDYLYPNKLVGFVTRLVNMDNSIVSEEFSPVKT